jgi:broad specificity phosphatase PhoE
VSTVSAWRRTAVGDRPALDGELPGWAVEYDRFDRGYGPSKAADGPIQYWLRNPMLYFEPPQVAAYRVWRGIISAGASAPGRLVVIASTHSAPMRALAATAFGRDLGEPDHLEGVRVLVHGDHAAATIRYRDLEIEAAPPAQLPPWIDREWLEPSSGR